MLTSLHVSRCHPSHNPSPSHVKLAASLPCHRLTLYAGSGIYSFESFKLGISSISGTQSLLSIFRILITAINAAMVLPP